MKSPFIYGSTVSKTAFTNRKKEINQLYENLTGSINTIIISPRRWGKSSLVEHVARKIERSDKRSKVVLIDLFSINSEEEFLELFAREVIKASSTKWNELLQNVNKLFKKLIPRLSFSVDPAEFSIEFDWEELKKHREEVLNLPNQIARQKKIKLIICVDEFQNIRQFKNGKSLEKAMRSYWQRHKNVTYCLYGSKRHMMTEIFDKSSMPFYRFGDLLFLPKIEEKDWVNFIVRSFTRTKKSINKGFAKSISQLMDRHSWYVQQFAHYVWLRTKKAVNQEIFDLALQEIKAAHLPFFTQRINALSGTKLNVLKAISQGEKQLTSTRVMKKYKLGTPNNVRQNLNSLYYSDIIEKSNQEYVFLDPVFEILFKEQISSK